MVHYKLQHEYLICKNQDLITADKNIVKITILLETEKCFKIKYENGDQSWITKEDLQNSYHKIEDLGLMQQPKEDDGKINYLPALANQQEIGDKPTPYIKTTGSDITSS